MSICRARRIVLRAAQDCKPPGAPAPYCSRVATEAPSNSRGLTLYSPRSSNTTDNLNGLRTAVFERMKLHKIALALFAALPFATACNSTQTAQNTNANARPAATAATSTPAPAATPDELAAAAADYSQFCIKCHKADGTGGTVELDEGEKMKVPSLREHGLKDPDSHLAKQIAEGGDEMPPFKKRLEQQRIDNLVRYVRREFHGRTTSP